MERDYEGARLVCHLCPNKLGQQRDDDANKKDTEEETAISLKNIFQYLSIDVTRDEHDETEEEALAADLCEECSSLTNLFGGIFQDFETARLLLIGCLQKFTERLERRSTFSEEIGRRGRDAGRWKAEILKHCHLKLQATPQAELDRAMSEIANNKLDDDSNDSSMDGVEETEIRHQVPNIYEVENQCGDRPEEGNISSSTLENDDSVSRSVQHNFIPILDDRLNQADIKPEAESHAEVLHILDINQGLIRRLSDVFARHNLARKQETTQIKSEEEEEEVASPNNICTYCGVSASTSGNNQRHMMLAHTMNYFSFPVGTSEMDVTQVVSKLLQTGLSRHAGTGQVNCKFCGGVRKASSLRHHLLQHHADLLMSELTPHGLPSNSHHLPPQKRNYNKNESQIANKLQIKRSSHQALLQRLKKQNAAANRISGGGTEVKCHIRGKWLLTSKIGLQRIHSSRSKAHLLGPGQDTVVHHRLLPIMQKLKKYKTCLYCGKTLSQKYSRDHVLQVHFFEHFTSRLPQGTSKEDFKAAIKLTEKANLTGTHHAFDCVLCSRVCNANSKRIHILRRHFDEVLTTLKSLTDTKAKLYDF